MKREKDIPIVDHDDVIKLISLIKNSNANPTDFFKWHDTPDGTFYQVDIKHIKFNFENEKLQNLFKKVFGDCQNINELGRS